MLTIIKSVLAIPIQIMVVLMIYFALFRIMNAAWDKLPEGTMVFSLKAMILFIIVQSMILFVLVWDRMFGNLSQATRAFMRGER